MRRAAENGMAHAQFNIAIQLLAKYSRGVKRAKGNDLRESNEALISEAVAWLRKSSSQAYAPAINRLAGCYSQGTGVPKDVKMAAKLYQQASDFCLLSLVECTR
jgi:TPR repeat protein